MLALGEDEQFVFAETSRCGAFSVFESQITGRKSMVEVRRE